MPELDQERRDPAVRAWTCGYDRQPRRVVMQHRRMQQRWGGQGWPLGRSALPAHGFWRIAVGRRKRHAGHRIRRAYQDGCGRAPARTHDAVVSGVAPCQSAHWSLAVRTRAVRTIDMRAVGCGALVRHGVHQLQLEVRLRSEAPRSVCQTCPPGMRQRVPQPGPRRSVAAHRFSHVERCQLLAVEFYEQAGCNGRCERPQVPSWRMQDGVAAVPQVMQLIRQ